MFIRPDLRSPVSDLPPPPQPPAAGLSLASLKAAWPKIVEGAEPAFVRMSLKNGRVHAIEGNNVIVAFGSSFHRDKASSNEGARGVDEALAKSPPR